MLRRDKCYLGRLPVEAVAQAAFAQKAEQLAVGAEKNVQPALDPVAIGVAPGRDLTARHGTLLQQDNLVAAIAQPLGTCKAGWPCAGDDRAHRSLAPFSSQVAGLKSPGSTGDQRPAACDHTRYARLLDV